VTTFQTTIAAEAYREWGVEECIRDVLQNGIDEETQHGSKLSVSLEGTTLTVYNAGASLPLKALLIGYTTKVDDDRMRGQFGEGLPAACLAGVRSGHPVTIYTGNERWTAFIADHSVTRTHVLAFDIRKCRPQQGVKVEIQDVDRDFWLCYRDKFLFLDTSPDESTRVVTSQGTLLLDDHNQGDLFVKGIWVANDPKLSYGYDLKHAKTDRDRKLVLANDLTTGTGNIWLHVLRQYEPSPSIEHPVVRLFNEALKAGAKDVECFFYWSGSIPKSVAMRVAADFEKDHSADAVPVLNAADAVMVGHFGKKGVVVPQPYARVVETVIGPTDQLKRSFANGVAQVYQWDSLTTEERDSVDRACKLLHSVGEQGVRSRLDVVTFHDPNLRGTYGDTIQLSRVILADRAETLRVLVHEVAHRYGGDGDKQHIANVERIWSLLYSAQDP